MRTLLASCFAVLFLAAALPQAVAAPQALGLIAAHRPVPLQCGGGLCTAEVSSFCLQRERPVPPPGTAYHPVSGHGITLVVTLPDGTVRRLGADERLRFVSARNYTAVEVRLPTQALAELGAVSAAVELGEGLLLVPEPLAADDWPQSDTDIAITAATRRTAGTRMVDRSGSANAARILARIFNRLTPDAHAGVTPRVALWHDALESSGLDLQVPGVAQAEAAYARCRRDAVRDSDAGLRWCLQLSHDGLIIELNSDYWAATRTGS